MFDDEEYFEACKQLSRMANERDITVLLAKLYADQMVATKENPDTDELPKTIPDLMLRYLSELNRNVGGREDNRVVHQDCEAIAWECLKPTYRPGPAERKSVIAALKGDGDDEQSVEARLSYLIDRLRVIQITGAAEDHIRFVLDPLAEYLAGLQVVEGNQGRGAQKKWEAFLRKADEMPGAPEAVRGFLLAVRDCCLASSNEVPDFVTEELGKRGGLDPEMVRQLQLRQRVRHLIDNLGFPDSDDRQHAATALAKIGPEAKAAIPGLVKLLKDPVADVRYIAAAALGQIGLAARAVIPDLANLLKDPDEYMRLSAVVALGRFGPSAKAVIPDLVALLKDPDVGMRRCTADALGQIGQVAEPVIPELVESLRDADTDVRRRAAKALGRLGPAAGVAIPELVKLLSDPYVDVRRAAAKALGRFGAAAGVAIPELVKLLSNPDVDVRLDAADALGRLLGPAAGSAIPELVKLLSDPDVDVGLDAADALGRVRLNLW